MKVLALNSSPRSGGQSKTELMLNHLSQGMREAGAEVTYVPLREKKVKNCVGCYTCWTKSPGLCIHKDDMSKELFPQWLESDLVIYASPLYHFTLNATMKAFIERTLPVLQPFFEERGNRTTHPLARRHPAVAILSVAGFPEDAVFEQLSSWAHFVYSEALVAEIYRAGAEFMMVPGFGEKAEAILGATVQAGRELCESMKVSPETMARIRQPLAEDKTIFHKIGNLMWKTCIEEGLTPAEFAKRGSFPRPDSIETFMTTLSMGFNPRAAGETKAVIEYDFSNGVEGFCHFRIANEKIEALAGRAENPDLTIRAPFEIWMDVITGRANPTWLFMKGKCKASGDLSLLKRMSQFFGK